MEKERTGGEDGEEGTDGGWEDGRRGGGDGERRGGTFSILNIATLSPQCRMTAL